MARHHNTRSCNDLLQAILAPVHDNRRYIPWIISELPGSCSSRLSDPASQPAPRPVADGERIMTSRGHAWGPPDLLSSSLPRSLQ